jgi:hypothetical protein
VIDVLTALGAEGAGAVVSKVVALKPFLCPIMAEQEHLSKEATLFWGSHLPELFDTRN